MLQSILKRFPGLERYNQIVLAIIGSGVIAAVVFSALIGLAAMLYSMLHSDRGGMEVAVIDEDAAQGAERKTSLYDFCQPLAVYESPNQLIPVVSDQFAVRKITAESKLSKKMAYDSYSPEPANSACGIHGSDRRSGTVNIIVRNVNDNSVHLLLKENAVIRSMEYPQPPANEYGRGAGVFPPVGTLYWEIAFEDSNDDSVIDEKDDLGAYLSNPDGSQLERVTPIQSRVLEKSYDRERNLLTLRILQDTNSDRILNGKDKPSLIEVNVAKRKMTREVLNSKTLIEMMQQAEPKRQIK